MRAKPRIVIEQTTATSALVPVGEVYVRDAMRRLGIAGMRDIRTQLWWLPAHRVDDVCALLEQRRHNIEIRRVLA
jgi:hypothetical protein